MDIRALGQSDLSDILDKAIDTVLDSNDWYSSFPKVTGYKYMVPEGYNDLEEYPDYVRGVDHAIARETVKHPKLHQKIEVLTKLLTVKNISGEDVIMADMYEHAGTNYTSELALYDKEYIRLYAGFLLSNDTYFEKYQHFDFVRIVRKWGWCDETYYLLFAHMFTLSEYFPADMDYLNYNGYPLHKGLLDDQEEADRFFNSLKSFLETTGYNTKDEELNIFFAGVFGELVRKHIYPDHRILPEIKEKADQFESRYLMVIEKLYSEEEVIPENNINDASLEEEIAVLGPEVINNNDLTQPAWSWDDEDIPEI